MPRQSKKKISKTIHEHAHSQGVYSISADNWEKLYSYLQRMSNVDDFVWRGHKLSSWKLLPTLYRNLESGCSDQDILELQQDQLSRFQRSCVGRRGPNPRKLTSEEWWAIGQHNGLMTPLLDWTRSPFVATYFAFWKPKTDGSSSQRIVYGLNKRRILELGLDEGLKFIEPLTDENSRLLSQAGLFTLCDDVRGIETWVRKHFRDSKEKVLLKIKMPHSERLKILVALHRMNINSLSLFPDIAGACMYTNWERESHLK